MSEPQPRIDDKGVPWCGKRACSFSTFTRKDNELGRLCFHDGTDQEIGGYGGLCFPSVKKMAGLIKDIEGENDDYENRLLELRAELEKWQELAPWLCRDGGQYLSEHGTVETLKFCIKTVLIWREAFDRVERERE